MKVWLLSFAVVSSMAFGWEFGEEVPEAVRKQVSADLETIGTFTGETVSGLHKEVFGNELDGKAYLVWLV